MENVKIIKLTLDHSDQVYQHMVEEFAPHEPVMSAFGILQGTDLLSKFFNKQIKDKFVLATIKEGHSFGAFSDDGSLLAIIMGSILTRGNFQK